MKTKIILSIVLLLLWKSLFGTVYNVPNDYSTIQNAIDGVSNGDTIIVEPGIYYENIDFNGKNIILASRYLLSSDKSHITSTIIDGNQNASVVVFQNGENETSAIIGFTIQNGLGTLYASAYSGGGIYINNNSQPILSNLIIKNNGDISTATKGGGICCFHYNSTIESCKIINNSAMQTGGIFAWDSSIKLKDCTISGNESLEFGSAISCFAQYSSSHAVFENTIINSNISNNNNSTIWFRDIEISFFNCAVVNNSAASIFYCYWLSNLNINNSIIYNNNSNSIIDSYVGLTSNIQYSNVEGGMEGINNIDYDPIFVDSENSNYKLTDYSPCIGAGNMVNAPSTDFDGNIRPQPEGTNPDIGAYENSLAKPEAIHSSDTTIYFVNDNSFTEVSPKIYFETFDTILTQSGYDSIIAHYSNYIYNKNYFSDTIWVNDTIWHSDTTWVNDTLWANDTIWIQDTLTTEVYDTTYLTIYDSIAVSDTLFIDVTITGINPPNNTNTLSVYPNPTKDVLFINTGENFQQLNDYTIKIISSTGKVIYETYLNQQLFEIVMNDFGQTGLYIIQIINNMDQIIDTRKIILE